MAIQPELLRKSLAVTDIPLILRMFSEGYKTADGKVVTYARIAKQLALEGYHHPTAKNEYKDLDASQLSTFLCENDYDSTRVRIHYKGLADTLVKPVHSKEPQEKTDVLVKPESAIQETTSTVHSKEPQEKTDVLVKPESAIQKITSIVYSKDIDDKSKIAFICMILDWEKKDGI